MSVLQNVVTAAVTAAAVAIGMPQETVEFDTIRAKRIEVEGTVTAASFDALDRDRKLGVRMLGAVEGIDGGAIYLVNGAGRRYRTLSFSEAADEIREERPPAAVEPVRAAFVNPFVRLDEVQVEVVAHRFRRDARESIVRGLATSTHAVPLEVTILVDWLDARGSVVQSRAEFLGVMRPDDALPFRVEAPHVEGARAEVRAISREVDGGAP